MRNTHISDAQFEEQLKGAGLSTEEWRAFLIREELIFECPEEFIDQFPDIDLLLERPGHIDSSVIRIPSINGPVVKALERVGCQHIAVLLKSSEIGLIPSFFRNLDITSITSASLHFEDVPTQRIIQNLNSDRAQYGRLRFIGVHGDADMIPTDGHHLAMHVLPNPRGNLHTPFLTMNQEVYMDALRSNSYFKRKIFIDDQGRISDDGANWSRPNIPSKLPNAIKMHLSSDDEPDIWNICKDDIAICHDCELRYMCIDQRLPSTCVSGGRHYTTECTYNPYIAKWHGETGYYNLRDCGVTSNAEGFSIDHERIAAINAELWGE